VKIYKNTTQFLLSFMMIGLSTSQNSDGDLIVSNGETYYMDQIKTTVTGNNVVGSNSITVGSTSGLSIGDEILIISMQDQTTTDLDQNITGQYETHIISEILDNTISFYDNLIHNYYSDSDRKHQIIRVPNFENIIVEGTITCSAWDGITGGVVFFKAIEVIINNGGSIDVSNKGYRGGV